MALFKDISMKLLMGVFGFIFVVFLLLINPELVLVAALVIFLTCIIPLSYYVVHRKGKIFYFVLMVVMSIINSLPFALESRGGYGLAGLLLGYFFAFTILLTIIASLIYELTHPVDVDPAYSEKITKIFIYSIAVLMALLIVIGVVGLLFHKTSFFGFFIMLAWTAPVLALLFWQKACIGKKKRFHKLSILTTLLVIAALAINISFSVPVFFAGINDGDRRAFREAVSTGDFEACVSLKDAYDCNTAFANKYLDVEYCYRIEEGWGQRECISHLGFITNNTKYCHYLKDKFINATHKDPEMRFTNSKDTCIIAIAKHIFNEEICSEEAENVTDPGFTDKCLKTVQLHIENFR